MAKKKSYPLTRHDIALSKAISKFRYDPLGYVIFAYPWGKVGTTLEHRKLEAWQIQSLKDLGDKIRARGVFTGKHSVQPILSGSVSGHGIGKSALTGMEASWLMSTRPQCKGTVTAGTYRQLETKTWPEITKWMKRSITGHWFEYQAGKIQHLAETELDSNDWRLDMQSSAEENYESFAGQHAVDSSSFYFFDESSKIPDMIWETAEGGLTDGEPFWFIKGNCNRNEGRFYEAGFGKSAKRWKLLHVDNREVSLTNKETIKEAIEDYGEDSDWVRVRIKGLYPKRAENQYIGYDLVETAQTRALQKHQYEHLPRVLGVDPAGDGEDEHVIVMRQGYQSWVLGAWKHVQYETTGLGDIVAELEDRWGTSATFVEIHGVGIGTITRLQQLGRKPIGVNLLSTTVNSPQEYKNKRDEMWGDMRKWLYEGGSIPPKDNVLAHQLAMPLSMYDEQYRRVESKN